MGVEVRYTDLDVDSKRHDEDGDHDIGDCQRHDEEVRRRAQTPLPVDAQTDQHVAENRARNYGVFRQDTGDVKVWNSALSLGLTLDGSISVFV